MKGLKMLVILLSYLCGFTRGVSIDYPCLHKGCDLSGGLLLKDLDTQIERATKSVSQDSLLKVMQWNILYDKRKGKDSWTMRKKAVCEYINAIKPDILTLQEVMLNQLNDLEKCLTGYHQHFGSPREYGTNPLYNPLFVRKLGQIDIIEKGTFWLSRTPNKKGSKLRCSKEPRICSWIKLEHKAKNTPIFVSNTHLEYLDESAARKQIEILFKHTRDVLMDGDMNLPLIITGDFNWESNSAVYGTMVVDKMKNTMANAKITFPEFTALPPYPGLIDYVWQYGLKSLLSATMLDTRQNGRMLSDHRPVVAVIQIK